MGCIWEGMTVRTANRAVPSMSKHKFPNILRLPTGALDSLVLALRLCLLVLREREEMERAMDVITGLAH
eukprot:1153130-Pelagomonas_calceolata.AAC.2